jgi:aryl-alcohol dehydrogenase-like predicted oxidoreductase
MQLNGAKRLPDDFLILFGWLGVMIMNSASNEDKHQIVDISKLGLGTVQWGVAYGISNQAGVTDPGEVRSILLAAQKAGVKLLDTASLYGHAETVIGANRLDAFKIVTKTPRFATPYIENFHVEQMFDTFNHSLEKLGVDHVHGLLVHHAQDLLVDGGERLVAGMYRLKDQGRVSKIGVSIYDGEQLEGLLQRFTPDLVQLPLNVFDRRLVDSGWLQRLNERGVEIHIRSAFLQGLLLMHLDDIPSYFKPISQLLANWHAAAREQEMSLVQAALAFVRDLPEVDHVLVGVESVSQFQACLQDFSNPATFDAAGLACDDPAFVNPKFWRK